jgi:deoxyribonuclease (pyrimidine dimer)
MVRINLINPKYLADQHLIAEYNEILMLLGYVRKNPKLTLSKIPLNYKLGKGHILFFKNKLRYLEKRFKLIKAEMRKRRFSEKINFDLTPFDRELIKDWKPNEKDKKIIKKRLIHKITLKPDYYKYYKNKKSKNFFIKMIENA